MSENDVPVDELVSVLDALLTSPELRPVKQLITAQAPTWFVDQAGAAALDARRITAGWEDTPTQPVFVPAPAHPQWLRRQILGVMLEWFLERSATCLHNPQAWAPMPVFAAAWKPGLLACQQCLHLLKVPEKSARYRTCAGCGVVQDGYERITASGLVVGPVTYWFGVCPECHYWPAGS